MEGSSSTAKVSLPPGVKIGAGRETSTTNQQNQVIQGMSFPITTPNGSTSTVFLSYADLHDTAKASQIIAARAQAIQAIGG
jgi:hypothetical protein